MKRHSEKGMALVITLMMLAITTFMAVVFLSLSRRERGNIKTVEEQMTARMMAEIANSRAQADLTAGMINAVERDFAQYSLLNGDTNAQKHLAIANRRVQRALLTYDLRTSRNFYNPNGFRMSEGKNPWNVNYFGNDGKALQPGTDEWYQNIANLQYDPRPPVIVRDGTTNDFRYYIDLNRNGVFDPSDERDVTGPNNERYNPSTLRVATAGPFLRGRFIGDPEWIGVLERPDLPHSETNRFIGRYAYIMLPTGKSLDINFIHNLAIYETGTTNLTYDTTRLRYSRNQGVGSYELNLAGFLMDLHTNVWRTDQNYYLYTSTNTASGQAFRDAASLLRYRLNESRANLMTPQEVFGGAQSRWANDLVDMAADGPLIPYNKWYSSRPVTDFGFASLDNDLPARYWHGVEKVDKTAEFPDVQRYFRLNRNTFSDMFAFYGRFTNAMSSVRTNTYDRYAYYRLLAQMGADSKPALEGKIHLNFTNEPGYISTNLVSWVSVTNNNAMPTTFPRQNTAVLVRRNDGGEEYQMRPNNLTNFFLMAADAMLRASLVTNVYIERYVNNRPLWRTNYTVGCAYFDRPELNTVPNDRQRVRRVVATPVRPDISVTNIQIYHYPTAPNTWRPNDQTYTNSEYSAAVHRVLQLAANIYDNMTNNAGSAGNAVRGGRNLNDPFFPTVFRPIYNITQTNITIIGWQPEENANYARLHATNAVTFRSPKEYFTNRAGVAITNVSFYGQPWVIGVKKGWPTFNEFSIETFAQVTRKLEVRKTVPGERINLTNYTDLANRTRQIYMIGFSNTFGLEAWNSYATALKRDIRIDAEITADFGVERVLQRDPNNTNIVLLSVPLNGPGNVPFPKRTFVGGFTIPGASGWPGRQGDMHVTNAMAKPATPGIADGPSDFRVPIYTNAAVLADCEFVNLPPPYGGFVRNPSPVVWQTLTNTPDLRINVTNRMRFVAIDMAENRVIDYVTFDNLVSSIDLDKALRGEQNAGNLLAGAQGAVNPSMFWNTFLESKTGEGPGLTQGVMRQIEMSMGLLIRNPAQWKDYSAFATTASEILDFQDYINGVNTNETIRTNISRQVPFSPSRNFYLPTMYQANDPLVHYTTADLKPPKPETRPTPFTPSVPPQNKQLGKRNYDRQRIRSDGRHGVAFQDPRVYESDDWQFPIAKLDTPGFLYGITNFHYRYPNVGALGQIHRGTPWQTVYLKAAMAQNVDPATVATNVPTWVEWAGSFGTHPTNDWKLVGLFTTAMSENAARGLLSVNQSNEAAWSAVLSGVPVITNSHPNNRYRLNPKLPPQFGVPDRFEDPLVQPASDQLRSIVRNINQYRRLRPLGVFSYLGEILGTPMLTIGNSLNDGSLQGSPFLNLADAQIKDANGVSDYHALTDEAIEAIPQRILSLLKEDEPRVTIYCFGQTLKPAARSFVTSADYYNLCVNYQVTGEYVTKAIVRVEGDMDPRDVVIENDSNITDDQRRAWKLQRRPLKTVVESFEVLAPFE